MRQRIAEVRDPDQFQRLVRKLMIAEHGVSYQVVDDSGGDGGLDGYERNCRRLHAIYCPKKPATARYRRKFKADLEKAVALRESGYDITDFVFVTPAPMREPDQRALRDDALAAGFDDGINIASEHLEVLLAQHPELHDQFPELIFPDVSAKLGQILEALEGGGGDGGTQRQADSDEDQESQPYCAGLFNDVESPILLVLQERVSSGDTSAAIELEQFRLEAASPETELAAMSIELELYFRVGAFDDAVRIARDGVRLAERIGLRAEESTFRVQLARALVLVGSGSDIDGAALATTSIVLGFPIADPIELEARSNEIQTLYAEADEHLQTAFKQAAESRNLDAMYFALMGYAATTLHKAQPSRLLRHIGRETDHIAKARQVVIGSHTTAIRVARLIGEERYAQALHNYANDLRLLGDVDRGLAHAKRALSMAEEGGMDEQIGLSRRLIDLLEQDLEERSAEGRANDI